MKQRCLNPNRPKYFAYGGMGITVCREWIYSFEAFFAYIGPKPLPGMSVDRIDTYGNYEPGNVRWADAHTQRINRRKGVYDNHNRKNNGGNIQARGA